MTTATEIDDAEGWAIARRNEVMREVAERGDDAQEWLIQTLVAREYALVVTRRAIENMGGTPPVANGISEV